MWNPSKFARSVTVLAIVAFASSAAPLPAATAGSPDPLVKMFLWWNAAYQEPNGFTAEAFACYFTRDAVMRINGKDVSVGVEALAKGFRDVKARTEMVSVELPFLDEFTSPNGDKIFTQHFVRARENGKESRERVMGFVEIKHGKISLINFVSVPEPQSK